MKNAYFRYIFLLLLLLTCKSVQTPLKRHSPRELFPGLFAAVQTERVFNDSKTFADCIPQKAPGEILEDYQEHKSDPHFNLKTFVTGNFILPGVRTQAYHTNPDLTVEEHIAELWNVLKRQPDPKNQYSSLIALPHPYVVPGGRFREIYYWDSYFTMLGLAESGRNDLIENMINNFAWMIRNYGFIPNGNRTYYLTRSQPPFFSLMVSLFMDINSKKADSILNANRDALEKEYHFWMNDNGIKKGASGHVVYLPDGSKLNRYYDQGNWPREEAFIEDIKTAKESGRSTSDVYKDLRSGAESGWDFSSRWFEDGKSLNTIQTTSIIPVDLNCLLYHLELTLAQSYSIINNKKTENYMLQLAAKRKKALERFCWDRQTGYFKDYNWKTLRQSEYISLAGMYPLYFKMVSQGQADAIAKVLRKQFLKPGGLTTTLINTGQQWDAPNGWAPLQWIAVSGLKKYKKEDLARDIAKRWISLNVRVYKQTGKLMEKYNVTDTTLTAGGGEYPTQDGFGWTNGVLLKLLKEYE